MSARSRLRWLPVAAAALLLLQAEPAWSLGDFTPPPVSSSPTVAVQQRCTLYANGVGFGAWCGGATGTPQTWRELLGGRPFIACRDDPVPAGVSTPPSPDGAPGDWWMETCIRDYNLNAVRGGPNAHPVTQLVWRPAGQEVVAPGYMAWLWDTFASTYPTPVLSVGPTVRPRVNVPAVFWLAGPPAAPVDRTVFDGTQQIRMTAQLVHLVVHPGVSATEPAVDCGAGTVAYDTTIDPFGQPSDCQFTYTRSSAYLPGAAYPVRADAYWEVAWTDAGGARHALGTYDVSSVQLIPVQEVEAVLR